jgi:alkanesulfonate monooxygenase SsuD/methylene tetrahydromethanopterin reductase-like flavin-dependent oxidoreductase (luciferase family)/predicted kinase
MRRLAQGTLVVLVGPSGAGKSTWARENLGPEATVSSDALRAVVGEGEHDQSASRDAFDLLDRIVAARLGRRLTTGIDSTGFDRPSRDRWRAMAAAAGVPCVAVVLDTAAAECRRRNAARERPVPARVLAQQVAEFVELRPRLDDEGFDEVVVAEPVRVVAPSVAAAARVVPVARQTSASSDVAPEPAAPPPPTLRFGLAEAAGFDSIWVMDHLRQIPQLGRAWDDLPESLATLGYLAAVTRTATIGALVHGVTLRNVPLLGKSLATLDVLAGGRVWCGLGAGWFEAEQKAFGMPFPPDVERLDLLEDALQVLPLLWGPGSPSFEGCRITVPEAMSYPRPLRGRIPILVGGQGERRTLRLAAQYADACNLTGEVEAVRHKVAVLHRHCVDLGRDPAVVEVTHLSTVLVAADPAELHGVVARRRPARGVPRWTAQVNPGTVEDHVLRSRALQAAGAQHLIVSLDDVWDSPALERYAEVITTLRG